MNSLVPGRILFAIGLLGLALQNLALADLLPELQPLPDAVPGRALWANLCGVLLFLGGTGIIANVRARLIAVLLAGFFSIWLVLLFVPALLRRPDSVGTWVGAGEILAFGGAALALAAASARDPRWPPRWNDLAERMTTPARICFALATPLFGAVHFMFADYLAGMIPAWLGAPLRWVYITGVARIAAGVSLLTGVLARRAATLLGAMYGAWILILHVPRIAAHPGDRAEWTLAFVACALCGGAWLVAASLAHTSKPR